jgi:hypothetical protein
MYLTEQQHPGSDRFSHHLHDALYASITSAARRKQQCHEQTFAVEEDILTAGHDTSWVGMALHSQERSNDRSTLLATPPPGKSNSGLKAYDDEQDGAVSSPVYRPRPCPFSSPLQRAPAFYAAPDLYKSACMTWIDGIEIDRLHHLLTTVYRSQLSPKVGTPYSISSSLDIRSIVLPLPISISPTCQHHVLLFNRWYIKAYTHRLDISTSQSSSSPALYTSYLLSYTSPIPTPCSPKPSSSSPLSSPPSSPQRMLPNPAPSTPT